MNVKEETICRLCLQVAENNFEIIDETIRKMFESILLKVNLDISKDPIICKNCVDITTKYFNFKSAYMDTERFTTSFGTDENKSIVELKDVHKYEKDLETVHDFICRFCSNNLRGSNFVLLYTLLSDVIYKEMLQELMPEMDCDIIKNSAICTSCKQDLDCYTKFVENCLNIEEKITEYIQKEGTLSSSQVKLSEILRFSLKHSLELNHNQIPVIKQEDINEAYSEVHNSELIKTEDMFDIKNEINYNESSCETPSNMPMYKVNTPYTLKFEIEDTQEVVSQNSYLTPTSAIYRNGMHDTIHHCSITSDIQSNTISSEMGIGIANVTQYSNEINKKTNQMPRTKNILESHIFKCAFCTYRAKYKSILVKHMLIHKDMTEVDIYMCYICDYKTELKCFLKTHMLVHRNTTEMVMYNCSMCNFETKRKNCLVSHMLVHKNIAEKKMYKCSMCIFETKQKRYLKSHMLVHKNATEVKMYKCSVCIFETKKKSNLKNHMLIHKDITEVDTYKCSMCIYEAKLKSNLKNHMLIHKDITEVEMYKCSNCTFETKRKGTLKTHMLVHKSIAEVEIYKCTTCNFSTKHKFYIKRHNKQVHKM